MKFNKKRIFILIYLLLFVSFILTGCKNKQTDNNDTVKAPSISAVLQTEGKLYPGDKGKINVTVENLDNKEYKFVYDDNGIITIDSEGNVTALKDGSLYVDCVSVVDANIRYTIKVQVWHELLETENYVVENIVTSLGEDASTMMDINYHAFNTKTYVEYTTADDVEFANALKASEEGYYFEFLDLERVNTVTTPRNVYHVVLKNLTPDTKYIYRINQGNGTYTETYSFKTAKGNTDKSTFLFLTDIHYATARYNYLDGELIGGEISERIISKALEMNPDINFILQAGDMIDQGGDSAIWGEYFKYSNSRHILPWVGVPGNHEYYYTATSHIDNTFFVAYSGLTRNGPSTHMGSSCYIVYNNILFLLIDNNLDTVQQYEWVEQVLDTVEHKWCIAVMHNPIERDNSDKDAMLTNIFEKYAVDMVLQGHYHSYKVNSDFYQGSKVSNDLKDSLGVTYYTGFVSGVKSIENEKADTDSDGYIFEVEGNKIKVTRMNSVGDTISTYELTYKKDHEVITKTKEELKQGLTYELNEEEKSLTFKFDGYYGNVRKVTFVDKLRGELNDSILFPTPAYTSKKFSNLIDGFSYDFDVIIEYIDGSKETLFYHFNLGDEITIDSYDITKKSASIMINANSNLFLHVKEYEIYVNDKYVKSVPFQDENGQVYDFLLENLSKKTNYKVTVKAKGYSSGYVSVAECEFKTK